MAALLPLTAILALPLLAGAAPQAAAPETFESAARRAQVARDASRDGEAIAAYQAALALRPDWDEGLWYLGTLLYQSGRRDEADAAFGRFLERKPQPGPAGCCAGSARSSRATTRPRPSACTAGSAWGCAATPSSIGRRACASPSRW